MKTRRYPDRIVPPDHLHVFERIRLLALAEQRKAARLMWVSGPPGSGKTIFVRNLLKKRQASFLWYGVDGQDNDPAYIFHFLSLAASKNHPRKKLNLPAHHPFGDARSLEYFARGYFERLFTVLTTETVIVLDNCQEMEKSANFLPLLHAAINQLPPGLQIICTSRNQLSPALNRLLPPEQVIEMGSHALRFDGQESQSFLKWLNPYLDDQLIHRIQSRTEGWAAGMVMLAQPACIADRSINPGPETQLSDYLTSEILAHIPPFLQVFLAANALLPQFTAETSAQLTGCQLAQQYLDEMAARNLLTECSTKPDSLPIYRFHPLLRELLLQQAPALLTPDAWQHAQRKAAAILIEQGETMLAMSLYQQLEDWSALKDMLIQQSERLIRMGQALAVSQHMQALPDGYLDADPWLNYWYAIALQSIAPCAAEQRLEISYRQFMIKRDAKGAYTAWQAAVESILFAWKDFSGVKRWLKRFEELRKQCLPCPVPAVDIQCQARALHACAIYHAYPADLHRLRKNCEAFVCTSPPGGAKYELAVALGSYYLLTTRPARLQMIVPCLQSALAEDTLSAPVRIMSAYLLLFLRLYAADTKKALEYAHQGLELSTLSKIGLFKHLLLTGIADCHIAEGNLTNAEDALFQAMKSVDLEQRGASALLYAHTAWIATLSGHLHYALEQNRQALRWAKLAHWGIGHVYALALEAQILTGLSQWRQAESTLSRLHKSVKDMPTPFTIIQYHMTDAWLAHAQRNETRTIDALKPLLRIMSAEQVYFCTNWQPKIVESLCLVAIEHDIEKAFAIRLLRRYRLPVHPPSYLAQWPWPVRIHSFGTLIVAAEGRPIEHCCKSQKKILELLESLVLLGGRHIQCDQLAEMLWPDADGDLARHALETSLHRLRKLIGKEAILLNAGLVSLNENYCWLDLWAFEATIVTLEQALQRNEPSPVIVKLTDRLLALYQDTFLKNTSTGPVILKQAQLLNKLCQALDQSIDYHERQGEIKQVCALLHKALEFRPLIEGNYRRLMIHYRNLGQPDRALQIYHQCHQILHQGFNLQLSNETRLLAQQLQQGQD